jgi:nucleoside 2-deoxyribosyltransferase
MLAEIRLAQFVVADFTFQRGNVYSEAGFAMGLGRPVIWTCREDHFDQTQFDTQQYNHIVWKDAQDLQSKLRDRILSMTTIKGL